MALMPQADPEIPLGFGWFYPSKLTSSKESYLSDYNIFSHCNVFGKNGCNFLSYPIGGLERYFWKPIK